jgi:CspA family cold shock protein
MAFGTLIWWNPDRGFGFIRPDEDGPDMFLHVSALEEAGIHPMILRLGQRLIYETATTMERPRLSTSNWPSRLVEFGLKMKSKV